MGWRTKARAWMAPPPPRMAISLGPELALTKTIYGHKIFLDARDVSLTPHILLDGCWEPATTGVFYQIVKRGMSVVEIGANIGYYSLIAAALIGPQGKAALFEPNPRIANLLFHNLHINGFLDRAQVFAKAVYSQTAQLQFGIYNKYTGGSGLFATKETAAAYRDEIEIIQVDAVSLDEHFPSGTKVDFIKIDAEGAEPHILRGASRVISENPHLQIMLEYAPAYIGATAGGAKQFCELIKSFGFKVFRIEHDSKLSELSLEQLEKTEFSDVILRR